MKHIEQQKARELRSQGYSIKEISRILNVAKSSASIWVRDVELSEQQKLVLQEKGYHTVCTDNSRQYFYKRPKAYRNNAVLGGKRKNTTHGSFC